MSRKGKAADALLMPLVAAGTSVAAGYLVKKAPAFLEETVLPRLREAAQGAEGLPERARTLAGGTGDLAEQLTERARGLASGGDEEPAGGISQDELARRSEERARRRAERRKSTRKG